MKILQLVAIWALSAAIHPRIMVNGQDTYTCPGPTPTVPSIVGLGGLCLEANRYAPKLVACRPNAIEQKWQFYTDGTVRSDKNLTLCLTANDLNIYGDILVLPCGFSLNDYIVWQHKKSDNTIENKASGFVMELQGSQIGGAQQFILYPNTGGTNQKWYLEM